MTHLCANIIPWREQCVAFRGMSMYSTIKVIAAFLQTLCVL